MIRQPAASAISRELNPSAHIASTIARISDLRCLAAQRLQRGTICVFAAIVVQTPQSTHGCP